MTAQTIKSRLCSLILIAVVLTCGVIGATKNASAAQAQESMSKKFGSREPRACKDTKAPEEGPISATIAKKYLECQMEGVSGNVLYLVENVKVEVGRGIPYSAIMRDRALSEIDVEHPVYPIRGSYLQFQIKDPVREHVGPPGRNATTYNHPKATGYCYKTTFGDWRCHMADTAATNEENVHQNVAPPKGAKSGVVGNAEKVKPANTKRGKPAAETVDAPMAERDENGFIKPDFSDIEKYFEIVKYDYNPVDGRFNLVAKATKETNIFRWHLTTYDADGVKVSETGFNGNAVTPAIGETTRIYSFAPNEKDIKQVARITITKKLD